MTTYGRFRHLTCLCCFIGALLLQGCGSDTSTKPQPASSRGAIAGRVVPVHDGVSITLNNGTETAGIDHEGRFRFSELDAGMYTVIIESPTYSTRRIHDVVIRDNITVVMGDVRLSNLPAPFFDSDPENGSVNVPLETYFIRFYSDEPISLGVLESATTIQPPIAVQWTESPYGRSGWSYRYQMYLGFRSLLAGAEHVVTIDRSLTTEFGHAMKDDLILRFTPEGLSARIGANLDRVSGQVPLRAPRVSIELNRSVYVDSLNAAVTISPPVHGVWRPYSPGSLSSFFIFVPDAYFGADVDYTVSIGNTIALIDTLRLPEPVTYSFHTEPRRLVDMYPRDGSEYRPSGASIHISFRFNLPVDTTTLESGIRMTTSDTSEVAWTFLLFDDGYWVNALSHSIPPSGSHVYIDIDSTLRFLDGGALPESFSSEFTIQ